MLDQVETFLRRFVAFSDNTHPHLLALWILHTWTADSAYATPYLYVHSAEPQSGKTRVLEVCQLLARNPISNSNTSTAAMFRVIESESPTLFLDEVDTVFTGTANEELRGVLNSGYKVGGSVMRFEGTDVRSFSTFCPKMLVGIDNGAMPDTLRDRCLPIKLKRKKAGQKVERFNPRKVEPEADTLRTEIAVWAHTKRDLITTTPDPPIIDTISDRAFEIAEPLLVLGVVCNTTQTRRIITDAFVNKPPRVSLGIQALAIAREHMREHNTDRVFSRVIATALDVTPKRVGVLLSAFDITPSVLRLHTGERARGYYSAQFKDAWERYM